MISKSPVLIIGMHRSGTSMITKLLAENGLFLGDPSMLLGVNPTYVEDNPGGYWEFKPAIELSDQILSKLGGSWYAPPEGIENLSFDKADFSQEIEKAKEILAPFDSISLPWGWKDPRNSLLINFWRLVFPEVKILVCLRNPLEVAYSLSKRTLSRMNFQDGLDLWQKYNQTILNSLVTSPYLVTHYESYFYNPEKELLRVKQFLELEVDSPINLGNIDKSLRRGMFPYQTLQNDLVPPSVQHNYQQLCSQSGEVFQTAASDTAYQDDLLKESITHLFSTSVHIFDELNEKWNTSQSESDNLNRQLKSSQLELQSSQRKFERTRKEIDQFKDLVKKQKFQTEELKKRYDEINIELTGMQNSRAWRLISRFRPFYGKIYWFLVNTFRLKHSTLPVSQADPISVWIKNRLITPDEAQKQIQEVENFTKKPLFSFLTPVFNPPVPVLRELIESIIGQTYPNWELCIVDGGTDPQVTALIDQYAQTEPRIHLKKLEDNYGISGNSNQALTMAQGEFIVICDHDDLVEPNLLFEAVKLINQKPAVDMIYYDEDKVDEEGNHFHPFLKPSTFSPELLISANYLTHSIIRRETLNQIGGFVSEMDGAQDWDIFLKISEATSNIFHINKILYHWRSVATSAASGAHIKPYALLAQKKSIENHLQRIGIQNPEYKITDHVRRARWDFPHEKISVIIPTVQETFSPSSLDYLISAINYPKIEYVIVGNVDELQENQEQSPPTNVVLESLPFASTAEAINQGAKIASGKYLFIGHPSITPLSKRPFQELLMWLQKPGVGIASSKLVNLATKKIFSFGKEIGVSGIVGDIFKGLDIDTHTFFGSTMNYYNFLCVSIYGMMMKKSTFQEFGGLTPDIHEDYSALNLFLNLSKGGYTAVANPFALFSIYPKTPKPTYVDIIQAYALLEGYPGSPSVYYNTNLSYNHVTPILDPSITSSPILDLETILTLHYQKEDSLKN